MCPGTGFGLVLDQFSGRWNYPPGKILSELVPSWTVFLVLVCFAASCIGYTGSPVYTYLCVVSFFACKLFVNQKHQIAKGTPLVLGEHDFAFISSPKVLALGKFSDVANERVFLNDLGDQSLLHPQNASLLASDSKNIRNCAYWPDRLESQVGWRWRTRTP